MFFELSQKSNYSRKGNFVLVSLDKYLLGCLFSAICNNFFRSQILNVICFVTIFFIKSIFTSKFAIVQKHFSLNVQIVRIFVLTKTTCTYNNTNIWKKDTVFYCHVQEVILVISIFYFNRLDIPDEPPPPSPPSPLLTCTCTGLKGTVSRGCLAFDDMRGQF